MDRPQLIRRLRIAVSVFFAVVAVALCVLWVRSYWYVDRLDAPLGQTRALMAWSGSGQLAVVIVDLPGQWKTSSQRIKAADRYGQFWGFSSKSSMPTFLHFPHWVPILVSTQVLLLALLPFFPRRFSLRTLLIATALVAVVLGLGVWAAG